MMRHWLSALMLGLLLIGGASHAKCLPTLGTDDCFRAADPIVQAIEHHYLDTPSHDQKFSPSRSHLRHRSRRGEAEAGVALMTQPVVSAPCGKHIGNLASGFGASSTCGGRGSH